MTELIKDIEDIKDKDEDIKDKDEDIKDKDEDIKDKDVKEKIPTYIREICLSGACNRGITYVGCFQKLQETNVLKLEKIVGVSIGSFIAACFIIGYTSEELLECIVKKDMKEFKDFSFSEYGAILKGERYKSWIYELLVKKINPYITLLELYNKTKIDFIVSTTCISSTNEKYKEGVVYLSHIYTPDIPLIIAVNCSMAFPFVFPPISYDGGLFIDGGVLDNFPLGFLSENSIGIKVTFKETNGEESIKNPVLYVGKIFELMSNRFKILKQDTNKNIVVIECSDFDIIDFDMSLDDKITLYNRGYNAMTDYLLSLDIK